MKNMHSTKKLVRWFEDHILELVAGFLLAFLPLYPKWPLLDALPGYIVRVRLEDFIILGAFLIYLYLVFRKKAPLKKNPLFIPIVAYLGIGLLSSISAVLITKTVPLEGIHLGKLALHWFRRVEYMSLAFIFFAAIKSKESLKRVLIVFVTTGLLVSVYGYGQKYYSWPVYSTMNREFSKGWRLVLTEHARVSSTFAGHYDLAAYLVVVLLFLITLTAFAPKWWQKVPLFVVFLTALGILLLAASKTSFIAFVGAQFFLGFVFWRSIGFKKALQYGLFFMIVTWIGVLSFGPMKERFGQLLHVQQAQTIIDEKVLVLFKRSNSTYITLGENIALNPTIATPVPTTGKKKPTQTTSDLPADVYEDIPESFPEASLSAIPATAGSGTEGKQRTYSETTANFGLSSAIRFDALWPRAFAAFKKNPFLGTGYATLVKEHVTDFTEAESTDNDYLRTLGETGILGLLSFLFILIFGLWNAWKVIPKLSDPVSQIFAVATIASLIGLMLNALYIDVFVSSKVAYTVWSLMGILFAMIAIETKKRRS